MNNQKNNTFSFSFILFAFKKLTLILRETAFPLEGRCLEVSHSLIFFGGVAILKQGLSMYLGLASTHQATVIISGQYD